MNNQPTRAEYCPLTHGGVSPLEPRVTDLEYRCQNFERQLMVIHDDHKQLRAEVQKINSNLSSIKHIAAGGVLTVVVLEVGLAELLKGLM